MDVAPRTALTRERILASATSLFGDQGIRGTSIEQIADAAGVHRVTVHRIFSGGRDELVAEVLLARAIETLTQELPPPDDPRSATELIVDAFTSFVMLARSDPLLHEGVCSEGVHLVLVPERFVRLVAMAFSWEARIAPSMVRDRLEFVRDAPRVTDLLARTVVTLVREPGIVATEADVRSYLTDFIVPAITRSADH